MDHNPSRIHEKYIDLHRSPEVLNVVRRTRKKAGEDPDASIELSRDPAGRIQEYLDYLSTSVHEDNPNRQEKIQRFKQKLYEKYCITEVSQIPDGYWESIQENHRRELREVPDITDERKRELAEPIIRDQKDSLEEWIDYLASPDAKYPDWLKYWAIRNVLNMGRYDKERGRFSDREGKNKTISPFPELNPEAFAMVVDAMVKKYDTEQPDLGYDITEETKKRFLDELKKENFAKLYGIAIEEFKPISETLLRITDGAWKPYKRGSNPQELVDSLKDHGTGWCIRGLSTAQRYLNDFDLEVYYSNNEQGEPCVPRLVIVRFPDGRISEFRGVAKKEEHDAHIGTVASQKLLEFGLAGERFKKSKADVDMMHIVYEKTRQKQSLTRQELVFLYEIDTQVQGFGLRKPERVRDTRKIRKDANLLESDMLTIFDCESNQIATTKEQIAQNKQNGIETKAYIGPLYPNIFVDLADIEHIYTSFPEARISRRTIEIGGQTKEQLLEALKAGNITVSEYVKAMINHKEFTVSKDKKTVGTVRLKVRDLGFQNGATVQEIYAKAEELGLDLCPPEVGPHYRLQYSDQPMGEYLSIAMKQISGPDGNPCVFYVFRDGDGTSWLNDRWAGPDLHWDAVNEVVFSLRKSKT